MRHKDLFYRGSVLSNLLPVEVVIKTGSLSTLSLSQTVPRPSELLFSIKREPNFPARITTQLVSLALITIEMIARKNEKKKQSKRKSLNEHNNHSL
jgi:hypothetical protein